MQPLYVRALGEQAFQRLPAAVRALHSGSATAESTWRGRADVTRGRNPICRALATLFALPPDGPDQPLQVTFRTDGDGEVWSRAFGRARFVSRQSPGPDGSIHEMIGAARLSLLPMATPDGLALAVKRLHVLGIPLPALVTPRIVTREWEEQGRYRFEVEARLAGMGRLVAYRGWLEPQ